MTTRRDVRDTAVLLALASALGMVSLAARPTVPWLSEAPDAGAEACAPPDEVWAEFDERPFEVERICVEDVRARLGTDPVTFIDARSGDAFVAGHIPGAISLPAAEALHLLETTSLPIPPDGLVVTYCDDESQSQMLGELLGRNGCGNVRVLEGGWSAWRDAGAPVEAPVAGPGESING